MKLETFFEKFDQFADAPDAVAKMRVLMLELAVRGKLSERYPGDATDPAWRAFLAEFDNRIHGNDPGPTPPFVIPDEWRWVCLEDLGTTKVRNDVEDSSRVSFVPMALISSTYGVPARSEERTWGEIKKAFTQFADGDVVMAKITPCFENAKSAVMRNLINGVGAGTTELHVFRKTSDVILPDYVLLYIKTRGFISRGEPCMTGSAGQKRVPRDYFSGSPFPLPPLAEQRRIVAKVDELMALCDRLEVQQQEREKQASKLARASLARFADAPTPANLHFLFHPSYAISPADLRKSILTLAFAGKLVSHDPNDEPASVLLEKARAEKARLIEAGLVKKEPWADKLQDATTLYDLPPGWEWTRISDVVEKVTVGFVGSMKEEYREAGVPFLRCQNVRVNRYEPVGLTFISKEFHRSISKSTLRPGDVVVTRSGNVGVTCVIPESLPEANCSDLVIVKRPLALVPAFLSYFINSIASGQIEAKTVGIALTHFNTQSVAQMTVALPPLAEQRRIVAKVDELMSLVDALETQMTASRSVAEQLLTAMVAELTGGEALRATVEA